MPRSPQNWRERLLYWLGRRLAGRHHHVHIPASCLIHPGAKIHPRGGEIRFGEHCIVADGAIIQGNVIMGSDCSVQAYTIIVGPGKRGDESGQVTIGDGVRIASHGMLIAANHIFEDATQPIRGQGLQCEPITIESDVWVGGRVNITAGVSIGSGSVIAAGAVVTKDVPKMSVVAGVPAKLIRQR